MRDRSYRSNLHLLFLVAEDALTSDCGGPNRNSVELNETMGDHCYWEEIKGNSCKYYRNLVTNRYLGNDTNSPNMFMKMWILFKRSKNKHVVRVGFAI